MASFYLQAHRSQSTFKLFALFTVVEYSFFCYFFYLVISKGTIKKIAPFIWLAFVLFAFIDFFFLNKANSFDSFASGIESIIVLLFCIFYLYLQIKHTNDLLLYSTFNFWVIITFLIYFSGTFFLYIMAENMISNVVFHKLYFIINISCNILKNILLCIAMCMKINDININKLTPSIPELDDEIFFQQKN